MNHLGLFEIYAVLIASAVTAFVLLAVGIGIYFIIMFVRIVCGKEKDDDIRRH